jgi:hypothetical protein
MRRIFARAVALATAAVLFDGALAQSREPEYQNVVLDMHVGVAV